MEKEEKIIELIGVEKIFDGEQAVENMNLYVRKGEFITILGPSGCGKSTTLRMIAGFEMPDSGKILLNGKDITNVPPYERPINTVFQRYALFPHLNVYDNIAFGLKLKKFRNTYKTSDGKIVTKTEKLSKDVIDAKVSRVLKLVDLEEFEKRDVTTLSGGQQQRIAIARAIVNEPEILLLDEPLGALDLKMRKDMQLELKEMHKKLGITFIYVTHDQEEALTMSDTIVVMKDGTIQQIGTPKDIYNEPKNAFVADFIGESNIFSGTMVGKTKVRFINKVFDCVDDFPLNEKVDVVVRPEDVFLVDEGKGQVDGVIISSIFKGVHYEMTFVVGKTEIVIQDTMERKVGERCSVIIKPDDIHIMAKEFDCNRYDGYITKKNTVCFADGEFACDVTQLYEGSHLDEEGYLITADCEKIDLTDVDVSVEVGLKDIEIIDNDVDGDACGTIIQIVYKGDHYQIIIRTDKEEEDFVVDTEYTWNENDRVSVKIPADKIKLKLKAVTK
ncbi:MAG: ABC transporter ATP-binding protein [Clostridia bacterium]|nr:ABC transporter ATP-binding protein [Clostridiales bacterium]MDD7165375.1 ABC transporter ATP-binding protein [Clostridia bacterium]MDY2900674.1 ABC transporter ATP-binding protein [Christensenellaceae bacterium]